MSSCSADSFDYLSDVDSECPSNRRESEKSMELIESVNKLSPDDDLESGDDEWEKVEEEEEQENVPPALNDFLSWTPAQKEEARCADDFEFMMSRKEHEEEVEKIKEQLRMERENAEAELMARLAEQRKVGDAKLLRNEALNKRLGNALDRKNGLLDEVQEENDRLRMEMDDMKVKHDEDMEMMKRSLLEMKMLNEEHARFKSSVDENLRVLMEGLQIENDKNACGKWT